MIKYENKKYKSSKMHFIFKGSHAIECNHLYHILLMQFLNLVPKDKHVWLAGVFQFAFFV